MINELIIKALKNIDMPVKFGIRGELKPPCIIFNYYSEPYARSTEGTELIKYRVLLNFYFKGDFISEIQNIEKSLNDAGFISILIANVIYNDNLKCWVVPMEFTKVLERELK